jgi:hypothetical protein
MAVGSGRAGSYRDRVRDKIGRYTPADRDDFCTFRAATFGPSASIAQPDYVAWLYEPLDGDRTSAWLFRSEGTVEGFQGVIRIPLHVDGQPIDALWAAEVFVSPRYLLRGVGAVLGEIATEEAPLTLAFEVTEAAKKGFLRTGWTDLGDVALFARPIDAAAFSRARGRALPGLVARAVQLSFRAGESAIGAFGRARGARLVEISRFDHRVDELWSKVSSEYRVIARRDARWLNWRFVEHPGARYRCYLLERRGDVVGYAVVRLGQHGNVAAGWVVDFLCAPSWAPVLLAACTRSLRREGAQAVYCVHQPGRLTWAFRLNGFFRRSTGWPLMVRPGEIPDGARATLLDARNWFVTAGDSNVDRPREGIVYAT